MKRAILALAVLACLTAAAWGYGYKLTIEAQGPYKIYFEDETALSEETEGQVFGPGENELIFRSDAEYMVLLIALPAAALVRIEITYLNEEDQPLPGKPEKFVVEGTFGGVRVRHPHWMPKGA